jgi:sulfur relay (sulfurtransferase) complex TusBCD TusD component (DsrE family)
MNKRIYACDICEKGVQKSNEMLVLKIELTHGFDTYIGNRSQHHSVDICIECAEKKGIIKRIVKKDNIVPEVQDVKARLYEVMVDLINESNLPMQIEI